MTSYVYVSRNRGQRNLWKQLCPPWDSRSDFIKWPNTKLRKVELKKHDLGIDSPHVQRYCACDHDTFIIILLILPSFCAQCNSFSSAILSLPVRPQVIIYCVFCYMIFGLSSSYYIHQHWTIVCVCVFSMFLNASTIQELFLVGWTVFFLNT